MMNKKIIVKVAISVLIAILFIISPLTKDTTSYAAAESKERDWDRLTTSSGKLKPNATISKYAIIMDAYTGKILYEENINGASGRKLFPASITKILTCLVILELENHDLRHYVTIGDVSVSDANAKKIGLQKGEVLTVEDLLYGLMLVSGNDAGVALAKYAGNGSVEVFADMMNAKAAEIGMTDSHFVNPHGLHDSDHYTTPLDMAKLAFEAMKNPTFRKIVGTYRYTPPVTNKHNPETNPWYPDPWVNSNRLISIRETEGFAFDDRNGHAIGIKTGFTGRAQGTLVAAAQSKDGTQTVITVVLEDSPNGKWTDTITMFMYAFDFYDTIDLAKHLTQDLTITAHVENAASSVSNEELEMLLIPEKLTYITDTTGVIQAILDDPTRFTKVENIPALIAPIAKDEEVGTIDFYLDNGEEPVLSCALIAAHDVKEIPVATPKPTESATPEKSDVTAAPDSIPGIVGYIGYGLLGLVGLLLFITLIVMIKRKAKYHQYNVSSRGRHSTSRYNGSVGRGRGRKK